MVQGMTKNYKEIKFINKAISCDWSWEAWNLEVLYIFVSSTTFQTSSYLQHLQFSCIEIIFANLPYFWFILFFTTFYRFCRIMAKYADLRGFFPILSLPPPNKLVFKYSTTCTRLPVSICNQCEWCLNEKSCKFLENFLLSNMYTFFKFIPIFLNCDYFWHFE